jgi:8-oxo-dGTP diphosphatase
VAVFVKVPGTAKVYAGIRKGSHGAGSLALPGGHLEMYETWYECAVREVQEEMYVTLQADELRFVHVTNDIMKAEEKHYVTIFVMGTPTADGNQIPQTMEPDKCEGWHAYGWDDLQSYTQTPIFGPLQQLLDDAPPAVLDYLHSNVRMGRRQPRRQEGGDEEEEGLQGHIDTNKKEESSSTLLPKKKVDP